MENNLQEKSCIDEYINVTQKNSISATNYFKRKKNKETVARNYWQAVVP